MFERFQNNYRASGILCILLGGLYFGTGLAELAGAVPLLTGEILFDPIDSVLLLVLGAVFFAGVKPLLAEDREGFAFPVVGGILATLVALLRVVLIFTNGLGWILQLEDWLTWNIWQDVKPTLWLYPIGMGVVGIFHVLLGGDTANTNRS